MDRINDPRFKYPDTRIHEFVVHRLEERGVNLEELAKIVHETQKSFEPDLTIKECQKFLIDTIHKCELLNSTMVTFGLDRLTKEGKVDEPLANIIKSGAGVFGVNEALASQIASIYRTVGTTDFGYFDRIESGVIAEFDHDKVHVNTFADDILAVIVAAVCGKIAHQYV